MSSNTSSSGTSATTAWGDITPTSGKVKVEVHYTATIDLTEWRNPEENVGRWDKYIISAGPQADIHWQDEWGDKDSCFYQRFSNFNHNDEQSSMEGLLPDGNAIRIIEEEWKE